MAEIEHFVNPEKRQTFDKFDKVADLQISFYSACNQMEGKPPQLMRLGDAVKSVSLSVVLEGCGVVPLRIELMSMRCMCRGTMS